MRGPPSGGREPPAKTGRPVQAAPGGLIFFFPSRQIILFLPYNLTVQ